MKYLLSLTLLFICLISFNSCGDETINSVNTAPDFDIYIVKRDFQNNSISTYTIKSDGSDLKLFNDSMGVSSNSYQNKILLKNYSYMSDTIYISNYDGRNMTSISLGNYSGGNFDLSPQADKFYFTSISQQLFIMNVDGSGIVHISDNQPDYHPARFSPSGKMIAYLEPSFYPNHRGSKLSISNTSGTYKKLLKDSIQDGGSIDWSNDGTKIVFHYLVLNMHAVKIGIIDTSLSNFSVLGDGAFPSCSPVSGKICFINSNGNNNELYLMDQDGSNIINISNLPGISPYNIKWSKNGMRILYISIEGSNPSKLWMYDLNTNSNTLLADSVYDAIWQ